MTIRSLTRCVAATGLICAAALPARADVVTFEDVAPQALFPSVASGGMVFTSSGSGFSFIDSAVAFPAPPAGSTGQFLGAFNDDQVTMSLNGGGLFRLWSFSASFLDFIPGFAAGSPGELVGTGIADNGDAIVEHFVLPGGDANNDYQFGSFLVGALGSRALQSVTFQACVYDGNGACLSTFTALPPQFAIDNIAIPEPGSVALALSALGLLAAGRRRRMAIPAV